MDKWEEAVPFDWADRVRELVFGGLPGVAKLVPEHMRRQALARLQDFNPMASIAAIDDLLRALRLAWIEAASHPSNADLPIHTGRTVSAARASAPLPASRAVLGSDPSRHPTAPLGLDNLAVGSHAPQHAW
jgi:hypothetical protein